MNAIPEVTIEEKFLFDLSGSLLLKGALSAQECAELQAGLDRLHDGEFPDNEWRQKMPPELAEISQPTRDDRIPGQLRFNGLPRLDPAFDAVVAHPRIMPYLNAFMDRPQLINSWSIEKEPGSGNGVWHRGLLPTEYTCRGGNIRSRMLNVVMFLTDNGRDDGCMAALPGSHKNNIDLPFHDFDGMALPGAVPITGQAGDVLLFSEAVVHNGLPKSTPGLRRNLYFNYAARDFNVMIFEPHNNYHFVLPPEVRDRFTPAQKSVTQWMEWSRA